MPTRKIGQFKAIGLQYVGPSSGGDIYIAHSLGFERRSLGEVRRVGESEWYCTAPGAIMEVGPLKSRGHVEQYLSAARRPRVSVSVPTQAELDAETEEERDRIGLRVGVPLTPKQMAAECAAEIAWESKHS